MKKYLPLLITIFILSACATSKNYIEIPDSNFALMDAVDQLQTKPKNKRALNALPILYKESTMELQSKIKKLENSEDASKWEKILAEYKQLQTNYEYILRSSVASQLLTPMDYTKKIQETKAEAVVDYYSLAEAIDITSSKENARKAYTYYKKIYEYFPAYGYKDSRVLIKKAFDAAIVNVVINPVRDSSYSSLSEWRDSLYNFSNKFFQQNLVGVLQNIAQNYPAEFYTAEEARKNNVQPDWVIDLTLRDIYLPEPMSTTSHYVMDNILQYRNVIGYESDKNGTRPIYETSYETVNATTYNTFQSVTSSARIDINIRNLNSLQNISYNSLRKFYYWSNNSSYYSGDSRALASRSTFTGINSISSADSWGSNDPSFIKPVESYYSNPPLKHEALYEVYKKLYPEVIKNIINVVE